MLCRRPSSRRIARFSAATAPREEAAWLATIARNECRGRIRDRMRQPVSAAPSELEGLSDPRPLPDELVGDEGDGQGARRAPGEPA